MDESQVTERALAEISNIISTMPSVAVAVSGGVDSLTLAQIAHRQLGATATMFHAVSPAVPQEATARVRECTSRYGWQLEVIDAGEFSDVEYVANPVNRCFFCKSNLYGSIARHTQALIVSGTNADDLADYRPGLDAAKRHFVRHPFVECGIDKATVRSLAMLLGMGEIADLPAAPCLSSRIETGIPITALSLALVHSIEKLVRSHMNPFTVRCRVRGDGLAIELDALALGRIETGAYDELRAQIAERATATGFRGETRFGLYRMGSAFVRP